MSEKNFEATVVANENGTNSLGSALTTVLKRRNNFINHGNTALKEEVEDTQPETVTDVVVDMPACIKKLVFGRDLGKRQTLRRRFE